MSDIIRLSSEETVHQLNVIAEKHPEWNLGFSVREVTSDNPMPFVDITINPEGIMGMRAYAISFKLESSELTANGALVAFIHGDNRSKDIISGLITRFESAVDAEIKARNIYVSRLPGEIRSASLAKTNPSYE